jgi:hypothetical protein
MQNYFQQTPLQVLERRLKDMTMISSIKIKKSSSNFATAKKIFESLVHEHMDDENYKNQVLAYWYIFADSKTTAKLMVELVEQGYKINDKHRSFFDNLLTWRFDTVIPDAKEAWNIYKTTKSLVSEKARFKLLLHYLILRSQFFDKNIKHTQPILSRAELMTRKAKDIAKALFSIHRDMFLNIDPKNIVIKYCRNDEDEEVKKFLGRYNDLSQEVAQSIILDESPQNKSLQLWESVAQHLLDFNDLFGYWSIYMGIKNSDFGGKKSGRIKLKKFPELAVYRIYCNTKNKKLKTIENKKTSTNAFIPSVSQEGSRLLGLFEHADKKVVGLFNVLQGLIDPFLDEFNQIKTYLVNHKLNEQKKKLTKQHFELYHYFSNIPYNKSPQKTTKLLFLRAKATNKSKKGQNTFKLAEHWDTIDLFNWLENRGKKDLVEKLIECNINDGPTFLEKFVFASSNEFIGIEPEIFSVFTDYKKWAEEQGEDPIGKFDKDQQFPVDLFRYPESSFYWIMWLRNQGLNELINSFFKQSVNSVKNFISIRSRVDNYKEFYRNLGVDRKKLINKLEHLKKLWDIYQTHHNAKIAQWSLHELESVIYGFGLNHLIPLIKKNKVWCTDRIFALLYFYQNFNCKKFCKLNYNEDWVFKIFDSLSDEYKKINIDEQLKIKNKYTSWLHLIKILDSIGAKNSLPKFYKNNLFTMENLRSKIISKNQYLNDNFQMLTKSMISSSSQNNYKSYLEQARTSMSFLGLSQPQIEELLKLLNP